MANKKRVLVIGGVLLVAAGLGGWLLTGLSRPGGARLISPAPRVTPAIEFPQARGGKVAGGPFQLVDHKGRPVSDKDYRGRFMLIYFGYTHCPDVCPTDLQSMSTAMEVLGDPGKWVQPLFISFDPVRDTQAVMADYVSNFHPRLLGLTGTKEQSLAAANSFDVDVSATYAANDPEMGYSMNHSAFTYLAGPDGRVRMMFKDGLDGKTMARFIHKAMRQEAAIGKDGG